MLSFGCWDQIKPIWHIPNTYYNLIYKIQKYVYCYYSVNVISYDRTQSDPIMRRLLYNKVILLVMPALL
jgi:hypothetical protein